MRRIVERIGAPVPGTYDFGVFHLDATEHQLLREGRPVPLPPKAFDLLVDLVEHAGHLREKKQLMDPDTSAQEGATVRGGVQLALPVVAGTPPGSTVHYDAPRIAISPDGRRVAYVGRVDDASVLLVGELEEGAFHVVPGTKGAFHPFFSPDGRSIGYLTSRPRAASSRCGPGRASCSIAPATRGM
jgi:hypothetical protein